MVGLIRQAVLALPIYKDLYYPIVKQLSKSESLHALAGSIFTTEKCTAFVEKPPRAHLANKGRL
jgi:hypothetical protein